jgi:hypothetical protein
MVSRKNTQKSASAASSPACQPTRQCPKTVADDAVVDQLSVRLEPDDTAVAVAKRMNPGKAMMGGSNDQ